MADWFASGRIVDGILILMLIEGAVLLALGRRRPIRLVEIVSNLAAGGALLLALRAALLQAMWPTIALWLLIAGVAHAADLGVRWAAPRRPADPS